MAELQINADKLSLVTEGLIKASLNEDLSGVNEKIERSFSRELAHSLKVKLKHLSEAPESERGEKMNQLQKKLFNYCYA